ncbi:MAG: DNA mismatch repair protein MutS2 [Planctomycetota bacterium]|jgi:DNA mismatch repair protein MutS2
MSQPPKTNQKPNHGASQGPSADPWDGFGADSLDWGQVLELYTPFAPSAIGLRALRELAPQPDADARRTLARAREMEECQDKKDEPTLLGGEDVIPELQRAASYGRVLEGRSLLSVVRLIRGVEVLSTWGAARREWMPACAELFAGMPDLSVIRARLDQALDLQGELEDHASHRLEKLRREIGRLNQEIEGVMRTLSKDSRLRNFMAPGQAGQVQRRDKRLCLAVRARNAGQVPGLVHDRSQSGETIFVEPRQIIEAGNQLAALEVDEAREVQVLLADLTRAVLAKRADLELMGSRVADIELALISARYARSVGGRVPRLPGEEGAAKGLLLRAARHPLLVQQMNAGQVDEVVPVDLRLGDDFDILIVTGPNTGGKTLALKTAGLAALCMRVGLAIPCADGTTIPLFDAVLVDVGDEQEVAQNLSTFSSHLARIHTGLERATKNSLVLLDELGGGTDPVEGAALSDALLEHLLLRGVSTLATTHLGKLKEFAFRNPRAENAHAEFDLETLAPLYRLIIGAPGESRALAIARRLGFSPEILDAAEARLERREGEAEQLMGDLREVRLESERVRNRADERLREVEQQARDLEADASDLEARRSQVEAEAERGLEERLARGRELLPRLRSILPQLASAPRGELEALLGDLDVALGDALMTDRRKLFLDALKKGEFVWVPRLHKRCQVTRIHREERRLRLRLGKQTLEVSFDDVTYYETL